MNDLPEKTKVAMTVEDYLNNCDYSDINDYVPSEFAVKMVNLIKLIEGGNPENKTPVVHLRMLDNFVKKGLDTINMCHRGIAKALSLDTQIPTPTGNITIKDLKVGDTIFTRNGKKTKVTHKSEVFHKPMYKIILEDGRELKVSEDHINIVQKRRTGKRSLGGFAEFELTTNQLLDKGVVYTRQVSDRNPNGYESKWFIPTTECINLDPVEFPLDPYTVGCILGDGSIDKYTGFTRFHTHKDDLKFFLSELQGADENSVRFDSKNPNGVRFSLKGLGKTIKKYVGTANVYSKRIPQELLWGSAIQRLSLLQGLMDTDGTVYNNSSSFCTVSEYLANDVLWLARSLGFEAKLCDEKTYFRIYIYADKCIFRLPRKVNRWVPNKKGRIAIKSITTIELEPSQCVAVDDITHSFLAESFIVTHNTTLKEYLSWYIAIFNELPNLGSVPYALYVSDSIDNGVKKMRLSLEKRWNNSEFLQQYIPDKRFTDIRWEFINREGKSFVVSGHGAQTGVRGTRENNSRPVLALLDDLVSDKDARSPTVIKAIEETVYNAIEFALHPNKRKVIWSGTPFNASDPLYKAVESGAWAVNVYPVCETFPCSREEFRGSWEDRFDYDSILKLYNKMKGLHKLDAFNQELMLRIMSEEDKLIEQGDIQYFVRSDVIRNLGNFNIYITTDFATSEKKQADFSVISVWAVNNKGYFYWIDGICKRQTIDVTIEDLFRLVQIYKPIDVGIEVTGQQGGFVSLIKSMMMDKNIFFNIASEGNNNKPGIRPTNQKFTRFLTVLPWFKQRMIYLPEDMSEHPAMVEAHNELSLVSRSGFKSKHDDFIDTISMLSLMKIWKPSESIELKYNDTSGLWEDEVQTESYAMSSYIV
ncbi:terminase large subunit [Vibrio phage 12VC501]|nr:terminase large subunit [Vibrio phage 12VC501]